MTIRVVHVATGNVGRIALAQLIEDPRFELVGLVTSTPEKVGKDAGELARIDVHTGIAATDDLEAALAAKPDCVVYCAIGETRFFDAFEDLKKILSAGVNVVTTSPVPMIHPWGLLPDEMIEPIEEICREQGVSLFGGGIDPGWANELLPIVVASTCQRVDQIRCYELANYDTYDGAPVMFDVMGFGKPVGEIPMLFQPGMLAMAWGVSIRLLGKAFGVKIDDIKEWFEQVPAEESYDVAVGTIEKGAVSAVRFKITGMSAGKEVIVIDHTTRTRPDARPDWPAPLRGSHAYRLEIDGEPSYSVEVSASSNRGDHNYSAIAIGAGRVVNAIPDVVAAEPGIRTALDLPLPSVRGLFAQVLAKDLD